METPQRAALYAIDESQDVNSSAYQELTKCQECLARCIPTRLRIMKLCVAVMSLLHPLCTVAVYLIVPFFVLSTPERGWGVTDLTFLFSAVSIGEVIGSQIVPLASFLDSDNALFTGHGIQITCAFIGHFLMSSILFFDLWAFAAGMFLVGFSFGTTCVQAYSTEIADGDETLEVELMSCVGQLYLIAQLVNSFGLSAIYGAYGFTAFSAVSMLMAVIMLVSFVVLVIALKTAEDEDDDDTEEDLSSMSCSELTDSESTGVLSQKSFKIELQATAIPLLSFMSPSMWVLLLAKFIQATCMQMYGIAYAVVFSQDFNVSAPMAGILWGVSTILAYVCLLFFSRFMSYPFDFLVWLGGISVTCVLYLTVYDKWIAYSFHVLAVTCIFILGALEMTHRLFLCPSEAFRQITGIVGIIQAGGYFVSALITPKLMMVWTKMPFLILAVLTTLVCVAAFAVYIVRNRTLNDFDDDDDSEESEMEYLLKERAHYALIRQSTMRRGAMQLDKWMLPKDEIQEAATVIKQKFSTRRGTMFLFNPCSSSKLEQFANHAIDTGLSLPEDRPVTDSDDDELRIGRRRSSARMSTMQIRKSIFAVAAQHGQKRGGKKMSMARKSQFRNCAPVSALSCGGEGVLQQEAKRRMKSVSTPKRASFFMGY